MFEKIKFMGSKVWDFLYPFIKLLMSQIGPMIMQAAIAAVKTAAASDLDNAGKRDLAFNMIKEDLPELATSVINLAIEAAVTRLKQ